MLTYGGGDLIGALHVLEFRFALPPSLVAVAELISRMVCRSGTILPSLSWNTDR